MIISAIIYGTYYSSIPKDFIKVENEILYFEERIRWESETGGNTGHISMPTWYEPIISYNYLDIKYMYKAKINISLDAPDFNKSIEIFISPKNPEDARHKLSE
ncbi:hypothetical protein I2486_12505 [Cellulophaga sp. E16_2]|uniref:hypothetical protein n=1 Tax=Cellulophaga sp. E16_2 TaxID=2789297 RepID=UPI001A92C8B1|nr:hypothetical protein [Cellulophaga sp. E16_2]MBO0592221.1 hypothetical protein [Cellulophaga sp. E16_2]